MDALPIYYSPSMLADDDVAPSFSPSAWKPREVVASWRRLGIPLDVRAPEPATPEELVRAHDERFVRGVLSLEQRNGFGSRSPGVARSLPWTSGAMRSAALQAWRHGGVAVAPCSGFHHAGWSRPAGFCTFNGLVVAALALRAAGARRVGILDCDHHEGDGTEDIIEHLGARGWIHHYTAGRHYSAPADAPAFFAALPRVLAGLSDCEVVLYQAGADPHLDDPLGGWLSTAQLRARDDEVFSTLAALRVPVAWNLAGGYQREADGSIPAVLEIHDHTLRACAAVYLTRAGHT
jgi:acetoin utilization deacetylase AcuC-like enzyme